MKIYLQNVYSPIGVCVTTSGLKKQLEDFPDLKKLVHQVELQSAALNCAKNEEEKEKEKKQLEDVCKRFSTC